MFIFNNHFAYHAFTKNDMFKLFNIQNPFSNEPFVFIFNNYYFLYKFQGIMPDSETAEIFSASEPQVLALQKRDPTIQLNILMAGNNRIRFGKGIATVKSVV